MNTFLTTIPGIILSYGAIASMVVVAILYLVGVFRKEKDGSDDRLINILQGTVTELEKRVSQQDSDIKKLTQKVEELHKENQTLSRVLQGRDEQTQQFYKRGFEAMEINKETNEIIKKMAQGLETQNSNISKLIELMGKQIDASKEAGHNIVEAAKIPTA